MEGYLRERPLIPIAAHLAQPLGDLLNLSVFQSDREPTLELNVADEAVEQTIAADSVHEPQENMRERHGNGQHLKTDVGR